jgi:hypothetical protein
MQKNTTHTRHLAKIKLHNLKTPRNTARHCNAYNGEQWGEKINGCFKEKEKNCFSHDATNSKRGLHQGETKKKKNALFDRPLFHPTKTSVGGGRFFSSFSPLVKDPALAQLSIEAIETNTELRLGNEGFEA